MYIFLKTAKRATKNHYDFTQGFEVVGPRSIKAGEVFLAISNGTIGRGARQVNIGNTQAIEMLEKLLVQLKQNKEFTYDETLELERGFNEDDIPF